MFTPQLHSFQNFCRGKSCGVDTIHATTFSIVTPQLFSVRWIGRRRETNWKKTGTYGPPHCRRSRHIVLLIQYLESHSTQRAYLVVLLRAVTPVLQLQYSRGDFGVSRPQGRHDAPIIVKFGRAEGIAGPIRRVKFHVDCSIDLLASVFLTSKPRILATYSPVWRIY